MFILVSCVHAHRSIPRGPREGSSTPGSPFRGGSGDVPGEGPDDDGGAEVLMPAFLVSVSGRGSEVLRSASPSR
ncbi:hypothetical protein GCM10011374_17730 [Kocuria dechangensis]|uniref:Uncharacterized protein n=1 Tax=Kocuria dechangensis TaxID=1176249 RepID=A0A917GRU3_9MICC|nr:hypothetical protein GCM10011374_17730 [Kocuria dechangensis]